MTLVPATRLGPYEIVAPLGAGGMGEVYRAKDSRLGREVAVKVLPAEVSTDQERLRRFEQEAKAASALNHPNILTVHDVGVEAGTSYLVTELLEGESLRARLAVGALPLRKAVEIGVEIARGLAAAHAKGIVHRDLKPENLFLTEHGTVKILDFGLAKLALPESGLLAEATTIAGATATGVVMGTAGYMAPEQVRGERADARSDLFALGCVLYEMASGRRAFAGQSAPETLSAILRDEPAPMAAPGTTGTVLAGIVRRCLEKRPEERFQSARDLGFALESLLAAPSGSATSPFPRPGSARRGSSIARFALAALLVAALPAAYWLGRSRSPRPAPSTVRFELPPPPDLWFLANTVEWPPLALSPDGRRLAFVALSRNEHGAWIRSFDEAESRPLAGAEGATTMTWSPDGKELAFVAGGKLKRTALAGGAPVPICDVTPGESPALSWGATGDLLFGTVAGEAIWRVSAGGGAPRKVIERDVSNGHHRVLWPQFLPGGRGFLYTVLTADRRRLLMLVEDGAPAREVAEVPSRVELVAPDWLLFAREGALYAQRFDRSGARLVGSPVPIAPRVRYFYSTGWAGFAASPSGSIALLSGQNLRQLTWYDRSGSLLSKVGAQGDYRALALSPDGRSVIVERTQPELGTYDLWRIDLARGVETRLTTDPDTQNHAVWFPDGKSIVYSSLMTGHPNLVRRDLGSPVEVRLLPRDQMQVASDISPDGRLLAFDERAEGGSFRAWLLDLVGDPRAREFLPADSRASTVRFSPDGRLVAYLADTTGSQELYVAPLDRPFEAIRVSPGGAQLFRWRRDGRELLFLSDKRELLAVSVASGPEIALGAPTRLFEVSGSGWFDFDVSADGERILAIVVERGASVVPASVVIGWQPEVAR